MEKYCRIALWPRFSQLCPGLIFDFFCEVYVILCALSDEIIKRPVIGWRFWWNCQKTAKITKKLFCQFLFVVKKYFYFSTFFRSWPSIGKLEWWAIRKYIIHGSFMQDRFCAPRLKSACRENLRKFSNASSTKTPEARFFL